jgi:hypothetical protein
MEMGVVVETSSHPINGKHAENGRGVRLSIQSFLGGWIFLQNT